jgi:hypothetical protein
MESNSTTYFTYLPLDVQEGYEQVHATEMKSNLSTDEDLLLQVMYV